MDVKPAASWRRLAVAAARGLNHSYAEVLAMPWDEMLMALDAAQTLDAEANAIVADLVREG